MYAPAAVAYASSKSRAAAAASPRLLATCPWAASAAASALADWDARDGGAAASLSAIVLVSGVAGVGEIGSGVRVVAWNSPLAWRWRRGGGGGIGAVWNAGDGAACPDAAIHREGDGAASGDVGVGVSVCVSVGVIVGVGVDVGVAMPRGGGGGAA